MSFNINSEGKIISLIKGKKKTNLLCLDDNKDGYNKVKLDDNSFFIPSIDDKSRAIYYICGASGSGKSTISRKIIDTFVKAFPDKPVYMFSRLDKDPSFDSLVNKNIMIRIKVDESLITEPIDVINDIEKCSMVIFDDIDTISDKKILNALNNIKLQILEIGRHNKIYCIITSHLINTNDRNSTRTIMNEMTHLIIFPNGGGSAYQQRYCLDKYIGFNKKQINEIIGTKNSRWVLISKNYPQYILTEKICYLT